MDSVKIQHGLREFVSEDNAHDSVALVAEFVGVVPKTVLEWVRGKSCPKGLTLLALAHAVELTGRMVLPKVERRVRMVGEILAFRVRSLEEAADDLDITTESIVRFLRGGAGVSDRISGNIDALYELHSADLASKKLGWKQNFVRHARTLSPSPQADQTPPKNQPASNGELVRSVVSAVNLLNSLLPYAIKTLGATGRKEVRSQCGHETISQLRTQLQQLNLSDAEYANL